jgi:ABC-type enterochelin transport system permease subunit
VGVLLLFFMYMLFMIKLKRKKEKKLNVLICIEFGSYFKKISKIFFWYRGL